MSALAAVAVIYFNGRQARKRATIDLMLHQKNNHIMQNELRKVWALADKDVTFASLAKDLKSDDCACIFRVLSEYEFVALGIRKRAFDGNIYKMSQYSNVMKIWNASDGFIREVRSLEGKPTLFQELELLIDEWHKKPITQIRNKRAWHFWNRD